MSGISEFETIPVNTEEIPQDKLDINNRVRTNLFAWNGQFSPQLVEVLLDTYARPGDVVLDPFVGSGTTLCEAARKGLTAYGTELNASAFHMAKTYELANSTLDERHRLIAGTERVLGRIVDPDDILRIVGAAIREEEDTALANILSTLIILMDLFNHEVSVELLWKKWKRLREIVLAVIPFSTAPVKAYMGDARFLNCEPDTATLLVTSPPYVNVFNYHQKYRRSVEALGYDVLKTARNEFGSNRKNRGNRLLTVIQYCIDMGLSMAEAMRVCKEGARMIYVVGRESQVLGYSFCNSRLVFEVASEALGLPLVQRQERSFKNRFGQTIYEDILHFRNPRRKEGFCREEVIQTGRNVAVRILEEKAVMYPDSANIEFLLDAVRKSERVNESGEQRGTKC